VLAGAGLINTLLALLAVSVLGSVRPGWYWWSLTQPVLFGLALIVVGIAARGVMANVCCVQLERMFGGASPGGRFVAYDVLLLSTMLAVALGLAVVAEMVQCSPLLGLFVGGLAFSAVPNAKTRWLHDTRNLSHWLARLFFAATLGFLMPLAMWTDLDSIWTGLLVAGAALLARLVAGVVSAAPVLLLSPVGKSGVAQVAAGAMLQGEIGFFVLFELLQRGHITDRSLGPLLWGLMIASLASPMVFQFVAWLCAEHGRDDDAADMGGFVPAEGIGVPINSVPLPAYERRSPSPAQGYTYSPPQQTFEAGPVGALPSAGYERSGGYEPSVSYEAPGVASPPGGKAAQFREAMHKYETPPMQEVAPQMQHGWHNAGAGATSTDAPSMLEPDAGLTSPVHSVTQQIRRSFKPLWQDDD